MNLYLSLNGFPGEAEAVYSRDTGKMNVLVAFPYKRAIDGHSPSEFANFMADSGAFTAMNAGKQIDEAYMQRYAEWVKKNGIKLYVELDLDEIVGVDKTREIRQKLENLVGYPSIPCWHIERGEEGWKQMCEEYDYVSISLSGFTNTSKWLAAHKYEPLKWFMREARKRNAKVHALGCNQIDLLKRFRFYSCDSSTHSTGARFGRILYYSNGQVKCVTKSREFKKDYDKITDNNVEQMIRMMEYARENM